MTPPPSKPSLNIYWLMIFTGHILGAWFAHVWLI